MHCGVIPYIEKDNKRRFILGIHSVTGDLCDFGGKPYPGETLKVAALREYSEESNSSFGCFVVKNEIITEGVYLLFVQVDDYISEVSSYEISGAAIYSEKDLEKLMKEGKVFYLICDALKLGIE